MDILTALHPAQLAALAHWLMRRWPKAVSPSERRELQRLVGQVQERYPGLFEDALTFIRREADGSPRRGRRPHQKPTGGLSHG